MDDLVDLWNASRSRKYAQSAQMVRILSAILVKPDSLRGYRSTFWMTQIALYQFHLSSEKPSLVTNMPTLRKHTTFYRRTWRHAKPGCKKG